MDPRLIALIYVAVTLTPLTLAALADRPPRTVWDELASGAGMLAFAIILAEFVLSGRFRAVSGRVGMDVTMRLHQLLARTALVLAIVHPFLYATPFNAAFPWDPTRQQSLTTDVAALTSGAIAWALLPALVLMSIGRARIAYRYEVWRLAHGLGAVAIAGLLLHHTLYAGRYGADPILAAVWITLFAVAVVSLAWVYVARPLMKLRRPWIVRQVKPIAERTWEVEIAPDGHAGMAYEAGQFVWLNIGHGAFSLNENPFSISSAPGAGPNLRFVIKELGDFTRSLRAVAPGTRAHVDGPHGTLTITGRAEPGIALLAGGVGIAPLIGILRQMAADADPRPRVLVYGNRSAGQIAHADELERMTRGTPSEVVHVLSEPPEDWTGETGMVGEALLRRLFEVTGRLDWLFVICGPPAMIAATEATLLAMGVPSHRIVSERFDYD